MTKHQIYNFCGHCSVRRPIEQMDGVICKGCKKNLKDTVKEENNKQSKKNK